MKEKFRKCNVESELFLGLIFFKVFHKLSTVETLNYSFPNVFLNWIFNKLSGLLLWWVVCNYIHLVRLQQ